MRKLWILTIAGCLLWGCGTKKRSAVTATRTEPAIAAASEVPVLSGELQFPMPEDTGSFIKFDISDAEDYIETFAEIAKFEMKAYGIPASITLAQGILESGYGMGELTRRTNNHFGIKCHTGWEGAYANHDDDEKGECFRKYNHPMYSFRDHSIFLSSRARYASLFNLRRDDYKSWARGLKTAGYATDRRYPDKLISFIERYRLYRFDQEVLDEGYAVQREPGTYEYHVHVVQKGDTLYSISQRYFIPVDEIMKLNRLNNSALAIGQELRIRSEKVKK